MKGFDVLKVKSAVKSRNKFDLSFSHLTTMDFGEIVPLFAREMVPGDEFKVRGDYFSRMAPLVKPTYGKFQFKTVAGFVPYHQVAYDADSWIAGKTSLEGLTTRTRYISFLDLHNFIADYCCQSGGTSDYSYINASGEAVVLSFSATGKYYVKVLNALGYACPQGVNLSTGSLWRSKVSNVKLSAYPLLSFFKLYNDYMSQSQRFNTSELSEFLMKVKNGIDVPNLYVQTTGEITAQAIFLMFGNLFLNYENDYFTSAWQRPNNAINNYEGQTGMFVPAAANEDHVVHSMLDNQLETAVLGDSEYSYINIGQRALDFLQSFDNWVRRNNYSGSRDVQQIYSRFGIKIEDYKTRYSHIIKTESLPIQVGDVTATADASNVPLGDYAGKGIMNGSKEVYYKSSDYGMLFIFGYFTVTPMNSYGFDRQVLRNTALDYYTPEFDGIGGDAISYGEVYASPLGITNGDASLDTEVFGFTERYNSYRYGRDVITGEFRDYNNNGDMNTWHTGRNLSALRASGELVAQSSSMNTLEQTDSQYNRIFSVTDGSVNHFYLTAHFSVDAIRPMLNLNQVVRLGEGNTIVPRNGNVIN